MTSELMSVYKWLNVALPTDLIKFALTQLSDGNRFEMSIDEYNRYNTQGANTSYLVFCGYTFIIGKMKFKISNYDRRRILKDYNALYIRQGKPTV